MPLTRAQTSGRWREKQRSAGRCIVCGGGKPCAYHVWKNKVYRRRYYEKHREAVKARSAAYRKAKARA